MSRLARCSPRAAEFAAYGRPRIPVLHEIRLGLSLGLLRAKKLTDKEVEHLAKVVADYDAERDGR
jgi:ribosomal protein L7/L12